jgi:UrcA family protein
MEDGMHRDVISTLGALAFAATVILPSAALAQSVEFRSKQVVYGDLDLASDRGAAVAYSRLQHAAEDVCAAGLAGAIGDTEARKRYQSCVANALSQAVLSLHAAKVTALYAQKAGAPAIETASAQ